MAMQSASAAVSGYSADAAAEKEKTGSVTSDTMDSMYQAATTFAKSYNSSVNSLYYAPSYSTFVQGIEKDTRNAVNNNLTALRELGFSQDADGALSIDEEAFRKAVGENPDKLQNLFNQNSNFMRSLDQANAQAMDSRSINKAEISLAVKENFSSYMGISGDFGGYSAQSYRLMANSSLVSMLFNAQA
jgi:flagellar capping protein FliD